MYLVAQNPSFREVRVPHPETGEAVLLSREAFWEHTEPTNGCWSGRSFEEFAALVVAATEARDGAAVG